jgi:hypothetical protein
MSMRIIIRVATLLILLGLTSPIFAQSLSDINLDWLERQEKYHQWGRDPFVIPSAMGEGLGKEGGLRLSAIIYRRNGGVAIINNRILRKGDRIDGKEIARILEDRVILRDSSGDRELQVNKFSFGR